MPPKSKKKTRVKTLTHSGKKRVNIPTAETENLVRQEEAKPVKVPYSYNNSPKRNPSMYNRDRDFDPQLVWLGKDEEDEQSLEVDAVPIYVQEHIEPKVIIDDIKRQAQKEKVENGEQPKRLFAEWDKELDPEAKIEFYQHARQWVNRMILGDSLQVMNSLAEKENLRGEVQVVYIDPPYGIKFASNWQPSTNSRAVKDKDVSREPEAIEAFRDTWEDGINSYLSYLRDRLIVAHELLHESGSIFFQIGDENEHLIRCLLDEVFRPENFISKIVFKKAAALGSKGLAGVYDIILWYGKDTENTKVRRLFEPKNIDEGTVYTWITNFDTTKRPMTSKEKKSTKNLNSEEKPFAPYTLASAGYTKTCMFDFEFQGREFKCGKYSWKTTEKGVQRLIKADRIIAPAKGEVPRFIAYHSDFPVQKAHNMWANTYGVSDPFYVVQTANKVIQRCILMASDPGDLVLDPTCGSGTTAVVSEECGRRWITIDTSRVSLALARSRLIGSKYDWYQLKSETISGGFEHKVVPHITLGSIANNPEIDVIWERYQEKLESLRKSFNSLTGEEHQEWEMPPVLGEGKKDFPAEIEKVLKEWWVNRIARQKEIDASILDNADYEELLDQPEKDTGVLRVTGPFTVESLSPHRVLPSDADDEALIEAVRQQAIAEDKKPPKPASKRLRPKSVEDGEAKFVNVVWDCLAEAGIANTKKGEHLDFESLEHWPNGNYVQLKGIYKEKGREKKAAIYIGPEYGTVTRSLMVKAALEAADYFDTLIVLGFAFEAHANEAISQRIGDLTVIRSRMNQDVRMPLKKKKQSSNSFVIFGEPDIEFTKTPDGKLQVKILGVDIFDPTTGEMKRSGKDDIACWFIDTDYNEEAFFVRHAYFSDGMPDPFKRLKTLLKAEISEDSWEWLYATTSRPFAEPASGKIAVKAINHYGDEVLRVFETTEAKAAKAAKPPS